MGNKELAHFHTAPVLVSTALPQHERKESILVSSNTWRLEKLIHPTLVCDSTTFTVKLDWVQQKLEGTSQKKRLLNLSHLPKLILVCLNCAPFPTKLNLKTCIDSSPQDLLSIWKWSVVILPALSGTTLCYDTFLIMGEEKNKQSRVPAAWFPPSPSLNWFIASRLWHWKPKEEIGF